MSHRDHVLEALNFDARERRYSPTISTSLAPAISINAPGRPPYVVSWQQLVDRLGSRAAARAYIENGDNGRIQSHWDYPPQP